MRSKTVYILLYGLVVIVSATNILEKYTKTPGGVYHGRYTRDVHEPEFLVPRHVHEDGKFRTYDLPKFYDRREINERGKRSLDNAANMLHLILPFNGLDHHVELSPHHDFISPNMIIETRGPGIEKSPNEGVRFSRASDEQCHYRGHVRGHADSRAALSLCDGVAGYIQTRQGRYFIEPVDDAEPDSDGQHVHMAYRREASHEKAEAGSPAGDKPKRRCGTDDNWEAAWAEQLAKRQQRLIEREEMQPVNSSVSIGALKRAASKQLSGTHSIHRYIELGLVCDRRFLDFHKKTDYERYLLTIINMVSDFYHDVSCGNQIDPVVTRIIYLEMEKKEVDLQITRHAENTLATFSKWAEKMNPKDHKHPNHYDIAVLITRHDLCAEGTDCGLMGLAYVAAACDPAKAACINEDSGLLLGIVVAHEVGHVMGCSHDELESSGCPSQDKDQSYFIMSPIVFIFTIRWSTCSRKFMTSFLESGLGECLNDDPRNPADKYALPNMLPGVMYDADAQCNLLQHGSTFCPTDDTEFCQKLWCKGATSCFSNGGPPADGTKCGERKWCIHMKCVEMGSRPSAVHGGWSGWGPMGKCSRTCGGGIKLSERECNRPVPANGGRYCIGERKKVRICNTTPCDPRKPPFRVVQCAAYNEKKIGSETVLHKWVPYLRRDLEPCALYCLNEVNTFMKLAPTAEDATPCKAGTNNLCLSGSCRKVGCDWVLDSNAVNDKCGVCNGDGTQCSAVEGEYTATGKRDYQKVITIPKGARTISVTEKGESPNTLAVKTERDNKYCLNGDHVEEDDGDFDCANSVIIYTHSKPQQEGLTIRGPIDTDIQIQYMFYRKENPGVHYKWYMKTAGASAYTPKYHWDFTEWGECSAKCGGGTMVSEPSCIEDQNGSVSPSFCESIPRPDAKSRICNEQACATKWRVSQWSKCNACDGKTGLKHRKVQCVKPAGRPGGEVIQADFSACKGRVPKQKQECKGERPCRKSCPKRSRNCIEEETDLPDPKERERSLAEQRRMIDNFVDLGLARYLQKNRRQTVNEIAAKSFKRDASDDFKTLLRDWVMIGNEERPMRTCDKIPHGKAPLMASGRHSEQPIAGSPEAQKEIDASRKFTTPKPGSIIKDVVPAKDIVLYEAPFRDTNLQANISDLAFQQGGDSIPFAIDTKNQKVYHGAEAIDILLGKNRQNQSRAVQREAESTAPAVRPVVNDASSTPASPPVDVKAAPSSVNSKIQSFPID